jgi:hypothetical protein
MTFIDRVSRHQPDAVKALLDLAFARPEFTTEAFNRIVDQLFPQHADVLRQIADELAWADQLRSDMPREVLHRLLGAHFFVDADVMADEIAAEKEANAVFLAQGVATLLTRGVAA